MGPSRTAPSVPWTYHLLPYLEQDSLYRTLAVADCVGAELEAVSDALASQLDLPKDQGLLVGLVAADSPAAKAGLQTHDILWELAGQAVPRDFGDFRKLLDKLEAKKPVDAVVIRKGKKTEVKGLSLPEAGSGDRLLMPKRPLTPADPRFGTSNTIILGDGSVRTIRDPDFEAAKAWFDFANPEPARTTLFRQDDRFTTRYEEGSLIITLTGTLADRKATIGQVKVQDGKLEHRFAELDKVPPEYRDKVRALVGVSEKGEGKLDVKQP